MLTLVVGRASLELTIIAFVIDVILPDVTVNTSSTFSVLTNNI